MIKIIIVPLDQSTLRASLKDQIHLVTLDLFIIFHTLYSLSLIYFESWCPKIVKGA